MERNDGERIRRCPFDLFIQIDFYVREKKILGNAQQILQRLLLFSTWETLDKKKNKTTFSFFHELHWDVPRFPINSHVSKLYILYCTLLYCVCVCVCREAKLFRVWDLLPFHDVCCRHRRRPSLISALQGNVQSVSLGPDEKFSLISAQKKKKKIGTKFFTSGLKSTFIPADPSLITAESCQ